MPRRCTRSSANWVCTAAHGPACWRRPASSSVRARLPHPRVVFDRLHVERGAQRGMRHPLLTQPARLKPVKARRLATHDATGTSPPSPDSLSRTVSPAGTGRPMDRTAVWKPRPRLIAPPSKRVSHRASDGRERRPYDPRARSPCLYQNRYQHVSHQSPAEHDRVSLLARPSLKGTRSTCLRLNISVPSSQG